MVPGKAGHRIPTMVRRRGHVEEIDAAFAGKTGEFSGGLRLVNARCEQDLSFGALLEEGRAEHEREIAAAFPAEI